MAKMSHASVRIEKDLYEPLLKEANEKYEGNLSFLIRRILRDYIRNENFSVSVPINFNVADQNVVK